MEAWQAAVNAGVGMIVMSVTELLKKWGGINNPLAKLIIVLILSSLAGIGLGYVYQVDLSVAELARQAMIVALAAVTTKTVKKSRN